MYPRRNAIEIENAQVAKAKAGIAAFNKNYTLAAGSVRTIHAALQLYVETCTSLIGLPSLKLLEQAVYAIFYNNLSKKLVTEGTVGSHVHNQINRDDLRHLAQVLLGYTTTKFIHGLKPLFVATGIGEL